MSSLLQRLKGRGKGRKHKGNPEELDWMDFDDEYGDEDDDEYEDEEYEDDEYGDEDYDEDACEDDEEDYDGDEDEIDDEYYEEDEYEVDEDDEDYEDYGDDEYEDEDEEYGEVDEYDEEEDDEYYEEADEYDEEDYESDEDYGDEDEDYGDDEYEEDDEYEDEDEEYGEVDEYDEEEYEDDEYYEDEDYEEDDEVPEGAVGKVIYKLKHLSTVDYIVALTGVAVLVLAVITGTMLLNDRSNKSQIEAFAQIGVGMEDISMIGGDGLVAVADAQAAKYLAAAMVEEQEEEQEEDSEQGNEDESEGRTEVTMNLTSIQKDLKIKFINKKTGKLISNLAFEVEIEKPSGGTYTMKDEDKDGIIYQTDIESGKYKVKITAPASDDTYHITSESMAVTVKDTIEYKKVDVADEVKTESQVNVAAEDTKINETVVESANTDTVEWVESTKTLIEGTEKKEESYEKVDKEKIADPGKTASAGFRLLAGVNGNGNGSRDADQKARTIIHNNELPNSDLSSQPTQEPAEPTAEPTQEPAPTPTAEPTQEPTPEPTQEPEPTAAPTETPSPKPAETPTAVPTATPTAAATATPSATPSASASVSPSVTPSASVSPSVSPSATPSASANDAKNDTKSALKTTDGETLYVKKSDGSFREAKYADYYTEKEFYRLVSKTTGEYRYTGWQTIDGATYFFNKNGEKVTGEQVIQGAKYTFNSDGSLNTGSGHMGIDVSKWNGNIDWNGVKNSGVSYVIIRCGYRGSSTGALIEDPMFRSNIQGASKAGLKVGVYFFTQAVNEVEAVEEASMVLNLIKGYNISYPVFLDVEASNGRADGISVSTRTAVCKAFCQTVQNSGYRAGIYANKTWFNSYMDTPSLTGYKIWLAQYAAAPSYNRTKYDMWQYSSKGSVSGIKGNVDMNISYMGY